MRKLKLSQAKKYIIHDGMINVIASFKYTLYLIDKLIIMIWYPILSINYFFKLDNLTQKNTHLVCIFARKIVYYNVDF